MREVDSEHYSLPVRGTKVYTKVFSALRIKCLNSQNKRFGVYQNPLFSRENKEKSYTPKSLPGVCGTPSRSTGLCWVRAASGPFLENYLFALKVGLRWVFVNGLKWVQKWVKSGFLVAKVGSKCVKTHFSTHLNPFRDFRENPLFTQLKGGGNSFLKRPLRQSRPSISTGIDSGLLTWQLCAPTSRMGHPVLKRLDVQDP